MKVVFCFITLYPNIVNMDTMIVEFSTNGDSELSFASSDLRLPLQEDGSSRTAVRITSEDKVLQIHQWGR